MILADLPIILPAFGVLALLFTWWKTKEINNAPEGSPRMAKIAKSIEDGAMTFLKTEYKILFFFVSKVHVNNIRQEVAIIRDSVCHRDAEMHLSL